MADVYQQVQARSSDVLPSSSNELVKLCLEDGHTLEVHKALLAMSSSVLRDVLMADSGCKELKVKGSHKTWQQILALIHPGVSNLYLNLEPADVEAILPVAHCYNIVKALDACATSASSFQYTAYERDYMYVLKCIGLSGRYHVPALATPCIKYIASEMAKEAVGGATACPVMIAERTLIRTSANLTPLGGTAGPAVPTSA